MPHQCTTCGHVFDDGSKEMLSGCPDCGGNTFQFHPKGSDIPETPPDADPPEPDGSTTANTVGRAATKVRDFVSSDDAESESAAGLPEQPPADPGRASDAATERSAGSSGSEAATPTSDAGPDPNATWPSEREVDRDQPDLEPDEDGIIDADARETARAVTEADEAAADGSIADETATDGPVDDDAGVDEPTPSASTDATDSDARADATRGTAPGRETALGGESARPGEGPGDGRVVSTPDEDDQPDIAELREQLNDQFESIKILEPGQYELNLMELYDREEYIIALQENGRYVIQVPEQWLGDQPGDA
ncbi:MAG: Zn-ribbon containing protein [Haloglomus sp.]